MALSKRGAVADNRSSSVTAREMARRSPARMRASRRSRSARSSASGVLLGRAMARDTGRWEWAQWRGATLPPPDGSARSLQPPGVEIITAERVDGGEAQVAPMGHPNLRQKEQRDHVVARDEDAVEGADGGCKILLRAGLQQGFDHGVCRRVLDTRVVERALDLGSLAVP